MNTRGARVFSTDLPGEGAEPGLVAADDPALDADARRVGQTASWPGAGVRGHGASERVYSGEEGRTALGRSAHNSVIEGGKNMCTLETDGYS